VTYYRYVRFFSNGTLLHHITTKEPHKVVHGLNQSFNKRQTFHGVYHHLRGDHVQIEMRDPNVPREKFCLTLKVKPVTKIRHQIKLGWRSYSSMPAMTEGEQRTIDISDFKPFFFSPVRTYKVDY
jgi:F-box protein 9